MNFFVLNDDVKSIITKHLSSDCKINKKFMTKSDDTYMYVCTCMYVCMYIRMYMYVCM